MSVISLLKNNLKNIQGWKTNRRLLAFAVDDYGNIRVANLKARENLLQKGIKLDNRFDHFDALDTREDYEMLFDVLGSVKDKKGYPAIFTPYAVPCNTDYQKTMESECFIPENLDVTYKRLGFQDKAYEGAYELLLDGIHHKLIKPQFHGREHLNVNLFNALLKDKNPQLLANIEYQSLAGIPNHPSYPKVGFNQAFAFWKEEEIELHKEILKDGLERFEQVYGFRSLTFTPPAQQLHADLYAYVGSLRVKGVDKVRATMRHKGEGVYVKERNILGEKGLGDTMNIVRNCVFEPTDRDIDWVSFTLKQIEAAFFWGKPAVVSSHRVNFCGHIDPDNRSKGLTALKALLDKVVIKWPELEFVSVDEVVHVMNSDL
jgi:hypothetical protein